MKAIAKYLPVDGPIKSTDSVCVYNGNIFPVISIQAKDKREIQIHDNGNKYDYIEESLCERAKLFVVTQDIEPKDEVWNSLDKQFNIVEREAEDGFWLVQVPAPIHKKELFKVLGEISPHAIWARNGEEIEGRLGSLIELGWANKPYTEKEYFLVKCSQCNTYH